jgi:hypothetical protein
MLSTIGSPPSRPSPTHYPTFTHLSGLSLLETQFDDDDLTDAIDLTAPPTPSNADRVARSMDQLEPFRCAPPPD